MKAVARSLVSKVVLLMMEAVHKKKCHSCCCFQKEDDLTRGYYFGAIGYGTRAEMKKEVGAFLLIF